jgi:hypothetical protein
LHKSAALHVAHFTGRVSDYLGTIDRLPPARTLRPNSIAKLMKILANHQYTFLACI